MSTRHHVSPYGAEYAAGGTTFRLWAPSAATATVILGHGCQREREIPLEREHGSFSLTVDDILPGCRYSYRVDGKQIVPDPASRFQPEDVHGPSEVVDSRSYRWKNDAWNGSDWQETVLYEMHIGTFTPEGTFRAAIAKLDHLASVGITAIEVMPVSDFSGRRNWGYDGVLPYAPDSSYGRPDDFRQLVDAAHERGISVLLDVVYNHFGPDGNYLWAYAREFFTHDVTTPWGDAIDFSRREVREFFIHNALYWLEEYFLDGLRLDAVHAIHDRSPEHFLAELLRRVHEKFDGKRRIHLVLENERNEVRRLEHGGTGTFTAQWNDDFHHAAHTTATGESAGYYGSFAGKGQELLRRTLSAGFVRNEDGSHLPPTSFVDFLQNHDQIGNRAFGERLTVLAPRPLVETLVCIQCLSPHIPMLFMGEEWGETAPFLFFCDFHDELADAVREGRRREFASFPEFKDAAKRSTIPDPNAESTRDASRLDWNGVSAGATRLSLYRTLFGLRRHHLLPAGDLALARAMDGFAADSTGSAGNPAPKAEVVAWHLADGSVWAIVYNLDEKADAVLPPSLGQFGPLLVHPAEGAATIAAGRVPSRTVAAYRIQGATT